MQSATLAHGHSVGAAVGGSRLLRAFFAVVALLLLLFVAVYFADEPARRYAEAELNRRLDGYSMEIPGLSLHPLQLSVTLTGLTIRQEAHPEPPVVVLASMDAGVDWRALLRARLVGSFDIDQPRLHIDRAQLQAEADDSVALADKGWQEALDLFPLKVNRVVVHDGVMTYIDADPEHPLRISRANVLATNLRKVRASDFEYPSELKVDAVVFDEGKVRIQGRGDLLAEPYPGVDAEIELERVPLDKLGPLAQQANIRIKGGILSAEGRVEAAPKGEKIHLRRLAIDGVKIDYVHSRATEAAEARRMERVEKAAADLAARRQLEVRVDQVDIHDSTLGYVDQMGNPDYRLFLANTQIEVRDLAKGEKTEAARVKVTGDLQGVGPSWIVARFAQRQQDPDIDLAVQIEHTPLKALNDLLRRYGKFDVAAGEFSYYSQLALKDGRIDGYVKPFFTEIDVYDSRQDADKALFRQLYEGLVGGVAGLFENRQDQLATDTAVRGPAKSPKVSTWQAVVNVVRNAFFGSILPGFDRAVAEGGAG